MGEKEGGGRSEKKLSLKRLRERTREKKEEERNESLFSESEEKRGEKFPVFLLSREKRKERSQLLRKEDGSGTCLHITSSFLTHEYAHTL